MDKINIKLFPGTPVAERITTFAKDDSVKCNNILGKTNVSLEENELFDQRALRYISGNEIYQFAEEEKVVLYRCKKDSNLAGKGYLNPFAKEIIVADVKHGRKVSVYGTFIQSIYIEKARIAYYKTIGNEKREIKPYPLSRFLFNIPDIFLTSEGVLLFYSKDKMLATVDLEHFAWIYMPIEDSTIEKVDEWAGNPLVTLKDSKGNTFNYNIVFYVKKGNYGCIEPKFEMI